jgi:hypothetical protein
MNCFDAPLMVTEVAGNRAWAPKTLPVRRWHARQWQTDTRTGSAEVIAESWPQEQEAVRTGIDGVRHALGGIPDVEAGDLPILKTEDMSNRLVTQPVRLVLQRPALQIADGLANLNDD